MMNIKMFMEQIGIVNATLVTYRESGKQTRYYFTTDYILDEKDEAFFNSNVTEYDTFKIEDNELIFYKGLQYKQVNKGITREIVYCDEMPRPEGFEDVMLYHGLDGFFEANIEFKLNNLMSNPQYQICTTTDPKRSTVGVIVEGTVLTACNIDMFSQIDRQTNRRYIELDEYDSVAKNIIHYADQIINPYADNNEIIMTNYKVVGLWAREEANEEDLQTVVEFAIENNLPFYPIEELVDKTANRTEDYEEALFEKWCNDIDDEIEELDDFELPF